MEKYNLDDKGGLFNFTAKKPSKVLAKEESIVMKHFNYPGQVKMKIVDFDDTSAELESTQDIPGLDIQEEDHVVLSYFSNNTSYIMPGNVVKFEPGNPWKVTVSIRKVRKSKDLFKELKTYVSYSGSISQDDIEKKDKIIIEAVCTKAVRLYTKSDHRTGDVVNISSVIGRSGKLNFKGKIAKTEKKGSYNQYVVEVDQITESNAKLLNSMITEVPETEL
jgi:hypothetical protein